MKDKRFEIIGEVDNIDIPDVEDSEETQSPNMNGFKLKVNKDNIDEFIQNIKNNKGKIPKPGKAEMDLIMRQTGMSQEQVNEALNSVTEFFNSAIDSTFIQDLESLVSEKGPSLSQSEIDRLFNNLFDKIKNETEDEDDLDEEDIEFDLEDDDISTLDYDILSEFDSYGVVVYERNTNILADFVAKYGEKSRYDIAMFQPDIKVSNAIPGLTNLKYFEILESNDKFILCKGIPGYDFYEPFYVAIIQLDGQFEMVVPEYGNSFDAATGELYNMNEQSQLFIETPTGKRLMRPADLNKIKSSLDLALFQNKKPLLSITDFGKVVVDFNVSEGYSQSIKVGKIVSNETENARLFKQDFNLDPEQTSFDFYVRLKKQYSEQTLNNIVDYLVNIDFNDNNKIKTFELKVSQNQMYIDIDLDGLPDNIDKWIND
jgi:NACalpha-BTF3-like transcription factor